MQMNDDDTYFNQSAESLALFTLFDAVPDYCLTQKFWEQIGKGLINQKNGLSQH